MGEDAQTAACCQVFYDLLMAAFLAQKKKIRTVQERQRTGEEPVELNPVWVSSRPWTS